MLNEKGMLVRLSIGQWTANKKDKAVSDEVAQNHNSDSDMGDYKKALVAREGLKAVQRAANDARIFHYENTLPWDDNGARILPSANFFTYRQGMDKLRREFEDAVSDVVNNYSSMVDDARIRLNGLFCASDYPDIYTLESKYYFTLDISPIPVSSDFRLTLTDGETDRIKSEIENRLQSATAAANRDAWQRLFDTVQRFTDTLPAFDPTQTGAARGTFRDSLVTNAADLCELLTRLNITDDPELERMRKEVEAKLTSYSAAALREDSRIRKTVTSDAESILNAMSAFMK